MIINPPEIAPAFKDFLHTLSRSAGVWIVGGWVRDALLGRPPHDVDFATSASKNVIEKTAQQHALNIIHDAVADAHGVYRLHTLGSQDCLDLACLRTDDRAVGGRHAQISLTDDIVTDLGRRDLSINAMAIAYPFVGPSPTIIDPFGGAAHLGEQCLQLVGVPYQRLEEDPLRLLRVARFTCLGPGWRIDAETTAAMRKASGQLARISCERVRDELWRAMGMANPERFWQTVAHAQAHAAILPVFPSAGSFCLPRGMCWLKRVAVHTTSAQARLTAFFVGLTLNVDAPAPCAHDAEARGMCVSTWLTRLRCSRATTVLLAHAVRSFPLSPQKLHGQALARWLLAVGEPAYHLIEPSFLAAEALDDAPAGAWPNLAARVQAMVGTGPWPALALMQLTGTDLLQRFGIAPGPQVGVLLIGLLEWATQHGCLQDRGRLLAHMQATLQQASTAT